MEQVETGRRISWPESGSEKGKGGLFHPLRRGKVRSSDMGGGHLGWREKGLKVEGRGLGWKCQMVHHCVSSDGGEHPVMAPTF